jgi:hypothetical protein
VALGDEVRELGDVRVARSDLRPDHRERVAQQRLVHVHRGDVAGQDDHPDSALQDRGLHRELGDTGHLGRRGDVSQVPRAVEEDEVRPRLLEVASADLGAGDVRHDREHRRTVAVAVVQPVEEVQAARARGAEDGGGPARDLGVGTRGKGTGLFVAHVDEAQLPIGSADRVGDRVRRVTDDAVHVADASLEHDVDEMLGDGS